eukprot:m.77692 g.77692  ORF g.77692 m.77692 type:complete len:1124 (+) comp8549_c1_seq1:227-3598(+)
MLVSRVVFRGWHQRFGGAVLPRSLHVSPSSQLFGHDFKSSDEKGEFNSLVERSMQRETKRQIDELILIPSESICLPECEKLLASPFGNIYAEGQPNLRLNKFSPALAVDERYFQAWFRRLSDARFYRGCIEADQIELLAKYYIAVAFSRLEGSPSPERIFSNFQALSGGPANLAVYAGLLKYGDRLLTMDLSNGGHLSHGSPFNVSGKLYNVTQYKVDEKTRLLDYDSIHKLAQESKPAMIVGGASAYPWDFDWRVLREIADDVGAYLHADVCHIAGMIVAGHLANPLPYAHSVMFTTHKTLMGPRGAVIVSTDPAIAQKIDNAVFPGLQGGPHMNNIAGIARLFEIIVNKRDEYSALQKTLAENALVFADALKKEGFALEYQGTNNHMVLIDLKKFQVARGGTLDGETASRLLENIGIIVNKNTLPGDVNAGESSGIRVATPWLTQRGITKSQLKDLASIMKEYLYSVNAFHVWAPAGDEKCRGRVPFAQLLKSKADVADIARSLPYPKLSKDLAMANSLYYKPLNCLDEAVNVKCCKGLLIRGEKARLAMHQALTCDVLSMEKHEIKSGFLLSPDGSVISSIAVANIGTSTPSTAYEFGNSHESLVVFVPEQHAHHARDWLVALSDGYVELSKEDPYMKVDGPFTVAPAQTTDMPEEILRRVCEINFPTSLGNATNEQVCVNKPFFVGQNVVKSMFDVGAPLPPFEFQDPQTGRKETLIHDWHVENGGTMVDFGGWHMPVKYGNIADEHRAVRTSAALFDVSHMSCVGVRGENAVPFVEFLMANTGARLLSNEAQYTYMVREDGTALDDAYVYRIADDNMMIVFNAGNFERDWQWINQVNDGKVCIDLDQPSKRLPVVTLTDLRDAGSDSLVDIAFQGPKSLEILLTMVPEHQREMLLLGKMNDIYQLTVNNINILAGRTGYTGENVGFELFVHPSNLTALWSSILENGKQYGVMAAGLGARDSARIEAGFPLFGHELEGGESLSLTEADYGYVSRFHRTFYVGRKPYINRTNPRNKRLLRLKGCGRKSAREGHTVLNENGEAVGTITSFAFTDDDFNFYAIAAVDASFQPKPSTKLSVARVKKDKVKKGMPESKLVEVEVLTRFPTMEEKNAWKTVYGSE